MNEISERHPMDKDCDVLRVADWVPPQRVLLGADVRDRAHALELLANAVAREHPVDSVAVVRALWRRELAGSTGLGYGIAIPHARISGISSPLTVFMRTKVPLAFDAPDGQAVSQFLAILVPQEGTRREHLQLLALIARLFSVEGFRRQLDELSSAGEAVEAFRKGVAQVLEKA